MAVMNKFWPGADQFVRGCQKIRTTEEYSRLAKQLSRDLREKLIESYRLYNGDSLQGISFTLEFEEYIKTTIESYFEQLPVVR